jgi:hypothetical protein
MIDAYARGLGEYWRGTGLVSFVVVFVRGLRWPQVGRAAHLNQVVHLHHSRSHRRVQLAVSLV